MPRIIVFNSLSLDGYFTNAAGDMSWAHPATPDPEFSAFTAENAKGGGRLLFGHRTYSLMAGFWPTPAALQSMPQVAGRMNAMPKIVFSRKLKKADWNNTEVLQGDLAKVLAPRKTAPGPDMVILGSGEIVAQLALSGLIDEYQLVIVPLVLGGGRTLFAGIKEPMALTLQEQRTFKSGRVFLRYRAAA
jgi:dihydrofolate reductase